MIKNLLPLPLVLALGACSTMSAIGTQFKSLQEPEDGDRARVRVSANMLVRATPGSRCMDWQKESTGTVLGGIVGSKGYRDRELGIPDPQNGKRRDFAEFYVRAGEPITFMLTNTPESRMMCSIAATFIPEKDRDYEITLLTEIASATESRCSIGAHDVTDGNYLPVALEKTDNCP